MTMLSIGVEKMLKLGLGLNHLAALSAVEDDPVWPPLVAALNRYGQEGRFYYLDALAENPQREESPQVFWDAAEHVALESESELNDLFNRMLNDNSLSDEFYRKLNDRIADSLQRYWDLVAMAGVQGVLGGRGKGWGHDFKLIGRQIAGD